MASSQTRTFAYAGIVTLGGLVFGLDLGVIAGTFSYLKELFDLSDLQIGTVGAAPGFGAIFALLFAGPLCDRFGRKRTLQLIALLYLLSALGSAFALSYWFLVSARFLGGLAFCSLAIASMYIGEIAPANIRGRMVAINQFNIVIGLTAAYFINYFIQQASLAGPESALAGWTTALNLKETAWRWMLGAEIPIALLWLAMVSLIPESPRWLMLAGREDAARASMMRLMPESEIPQEVAAIQESIAKTGSGGSLVMQFRRLFSKQARRAVLVGVVIVTVQPITGINAINTYAPMIFAQTGVADPLKQTIWLGVVSLVANVFAFLLVDRLGRRPVVVFGLLWCAISLGICAWGFHQARYSLSSETTAAAAQEISKELGEARSQAAEQLATVTDVVYPNDVAFMQGMREALGEELANKNKDYLVGKAAAIDGRLVIFGILSFMAAFQFSIGPVMWVVLSEIFPTELRGIAIPGAQLITAVVNYFVQLLFPWQLANMGARDIFLFYGVCVTVGLIILWMILPETKNKSIEQIEEELSQPA